MRACVAVLIDTNLPVKNKYPHITVAVNGVKPAYSNELLEAKDKAGEIRRVKGKLRVKVGYFDGRVVEISLSYLTSSLRVKTDFPKWL